MNRVGEVRDGADSVGVDGARQGLARAHRAVGDRDALGFCAAVRGAEFDYFAGTDEEDAFALERPEGGQRQAHGRGGEATELAPIAVAVRTSFATVKVAWKKVVGHHAEAVVLARQLSAFFIWPTICVSPRTMESDPRRRGRCGGGLFLLKV